jgi:hypothetical protein
VETDWYLSEKKQFVKKVSEENKKDAPFQI